MSEEATQPNSMPNDFTEKDIREYFTKSSIIDALELLLQELEEKRPREPLKWLGISFIRYHVNNVMGNSSDRDTIVEHYRSHFEEMAKLEQNTCTKELDDSSETKEQPNTYFEKEIIPALMNGLYNSIIEKKEKPLEVLGLFLMDKNEDALKGPLHEETPLVNDNAHN
eukprot:GAHX01000336.1.p1 GENE.GAHX01000336.1~~GAHX01000336.1.p1  ORF type:complete len:168 (+),score=36.45 GAHX01000336.1:43-546(+)